MAVIQRTECWGMSIRLLSQGIILILVLAAVQCSPSRECEQVKKDFETARFPADWLENAPTGGETCGRNSCCSKQSEQDMFLESRRQLDTYLQESIKRLSSQIESRARRFDDLFRHMMNTSKTEFHEMFQKTYGKIYLQNSDVFSDFFKELESYYRRGSTPLSDTLETFFVILYQRMFEVINSQYLFDDKYRVCISEHMKDVKPFGDVPQKFAIQLKRSFIATRAYYKALAIAAEVARKLQNVGIDKDCEKEMVQMRYCGSCNGLNGAGPCSKYCAGVLQSCLRHHVAFSTEWDNFVDALDKVADRLVGPYNIEIVVEPLNIKISEAIMTFQDTGADVSQKIYQFCGEPTLRTRRKRKTNLRDTAEEYEFMNKCGKNCMKKQNGSKRQKNKKFEEEDRGSDLERLIKEIKMKVRDTRQFWAQLPYQFCNNISASPSDNGRCWNGTSIGDYRDFPKVPPSNSSIVKDQIYVLQKFTDHLRKAYSGEEVEFEDDAEENLDGSGSGSGDFEIDTEDGEVPKNVPTKEDDFETVDNEVHRAQPLPSTVKPDVSKATGAAASMSLNKALAQYLIPIVLVWFGGAISDLL